MPDNKIITDREEMLEAVKSSGFALAYADDPDRVQYSSG